LTSFAVEELLAGMTTKEDSGLKNAGTRVGWPDAVAEQRKQFTAQTDAVRGEVVALRRLARGKRCRIHFDFERARELCQLSFEQARELVHPYTETLSQILMGNAYLGLGRRGPAFQCFNTAIGRLEASRSLMDWVLRMPLHNGLSRYWLAEGMDEYSAGRVRLISYGRVRADAVIG